MEATIIASRNLPSSAALDALHRLAESLRSQPANQDHLLQVVDGIDQTVLRTSMPDADQDAGVASIALAAELATFAYFCATLLDWFTDDRSPQEYRHATHGDPTNQNVAPMADRLARAHQNFSMHPRAAWTAVSDIRKQHLVWPFR